MQQKHALDIKNSPVSGKIAMLCQEVTEID